MLMFREVIIEIEQLITMMKYREQKIGKRREKIEPLYERSKELLQQLMKELSLDSFYQRILENYHEVMSLY
jgi:hypothetical protein